jgi:hypothetical protein
MASSSTPCQTTLRLCPMRWKLHRQRWSLTLLGGTLCPGASITTARLDRSWIVRTRGSVRALRSYDIDACVDNNPPVRTGWYAARFVHGS